MTQGGTPLIYGFDLLMEGAWNTVWICSLAALCGFTVAVLMAWSLLSAPRPLRYLSVAGVEFIRNTPFLVQALFIYFGLPALGIRLSPAAVGIAVLTLNIGFYTAEILRGGLASLPAGLDEAARSLGLGPVTRFFSVLLPPAAASVYPSIVSQFTLLMLSSSVLSAVSVPELTAAANDIQNQNFRTTQTYLITAAIYLGLSFMFVMVLRGAGRLAFGFARKRVH